MRLVYRSPLHILDKRMSVKLNNPQATENPVRVAHLVKFPDK